MKKLASIGIFILLCFNCVKAQTNVQNEPSFSEQVIKTSDLILEGTVTSISYFRDTTNAVRSYSFYNHASDDKGVWFIKYEITIHKLFKGEKANKVSVISVCHGYPISNDTIQVSLSYSPHVDTQSDLIVNQTCIFLLTKSFAPDLPLNTNSYYFNYVHGYIGRYNLLTESILYIPDKGVVRKFETLDDLYKYLEKETKTKKIDITHKQFFVNNSGEKFENYIGTHFGDSSNSESFMKKIRNGTINQLNADSFFVKQKPPLSKKELRMLQRQRDSCQKVFEKNHLENLKRIKEETNYPKSGSLHKVDETLIYRKICLSCILAKMKIEHIAPMVA